MPAFDGVGSSNWARSTTALLRAPARTAGRRRHQGRAAQRGATALPLARAGRVPRVRHAQLQQAQCGARPEDRRRPPGAARPGGDRRRAHRELRAGHDAAPATEPAAAAGAQPAPGRGLRQGLRVHGSLRTHVRHGHHGAGDVRCRLGHRGARRAADQGGAAFVDFSGGILFAAISAALFQRERTGQGIVEVSMHDTIYPMLASSLGALHNTPSGSSRTHREPALAVAPYNIYPASDGWLAIICISERHWRGVATALGPGRADRRPQVPHDEGPGRQHRHGRRGGVVGDQRPHPRRAGPRPAGRRCRVRRSSRSVRSTPTST